MKRLAPSALDRSAPWQGSRSSSLRRTFAPSVPICALLLGLSGCGEERDDEPGLTGSSLTQGSMPSGGSDGGGLTSTPTTDSDPTGGAGIFDVGGSAGPGSGNPEGTNEGCEKVDFLFVIDGSGSMGDNQDSLIASFPGFIDSIRTSLDEAQDYHIMVVDTDSEWGGECSFLCALGTCLSIPEYPCASGPPSECDTQLGAGVNYTMADDAPNEFCDFSTGRRYMDSSEPDLTSAFQCAAKVGSDGDSNERPMGAMVAAFSEDLGQPGGCNEGFIRDDAILVVTFITDEEDSDSNGSPEGWFANVVASKGGDASSVVMLGLINDVDQPQPVCPAESQDPAKLRSFIDMFPNAIRGSVCEPSYNSFFQEAVDLIATTCEEFVPPEG